MRVVLARHAAGVVGAGVILAPLVTVAMPYRGGLMLRAGLVTALTAALAITAMFSPGWRDRLRTRPRPLLIGCGCYAAATLLGALVALVRGNDSTLLAGQLLAMGLLPAAALAGLAMDRSWRSLAVGVVAAVTVGAWVQICWWLWSLTHGRISDRLYLPNSVSVVGPALLALVLAVSLLGRRRRHETVLAWFAVLTVAALIAGSAVRGLWVIALPCLVLQLVLWKGWSRVARPRMVLIPGGVLAAALLGHLLFEAWLARARPSLLADSPATALVVANRHRDAIGSNGSLQLSFPGQRGFRSALFTVDQPGSYMLRARVSGGERGAALVYVRWLDADDRLIGRLGVRFPAGVDRGLVTNFGVAPEGTTAAFVRCAGDRAAAGSWTLTQVSLHRLGSHRLAPVLRQRTVWLRRMESLASLLVGNDPGQDPALAFRLTEATRVLRAVRGSSFSGWIFGRGLGATVHLGVEGYDNRGNRVWYGDVNYIHNLYLFLLYKLGLAGAALVLAALVLWIGWTLRRTLATPQGEHRALLAAVSAAWIAYSVWAVTSPELIDFSMAPLFGLLVAAAADAAGNRPRRTG